MNNHNGIRVCVCVCVCVCVHMRVYECACINIMQKVKTDMFVNVGHVPLKCVLIIYSLLQTGAH